MNEEAQKNSEFHYIARFLLGLYQKRLFEFKGIIQKADIRREFREYTSKNPFPDIQRTKLGTHLRNHGFLFHFKSTKPVDHFVINMKTFREYLNNLVKELDEAQKKQTYKRITIDSASQEFEEEVVEVDPESAVESLQFQGNFVQNATNDFTISSKGCYICQKNFGLESEYEDHIDYHTQATDFKSLQVKDKTFFQNIRISYQNCKNSHLLRFNIECRCEPVEIDKIIIVRPNSMLYIQEEKTPYTLTMGDTSNFFVDCHIFEITYEHPVIVIYKKMGEKGLSRRYVEQHHFLRLEPFNVQLMKLISSRIPKRGQLEFKKTLKDYHPTQKVKELCKSDDVSNSILEDLSSIFTDYLRNNQNLDINNIYVIFEYLLQIEDVIAQKAYNKLTQYKKTIKGIGGDYSVALTVSPDVNVENILSDGDKIRLVIVDDDKNKKPKPFYGFIDRVSKWRVFFSNRGRKLNLPLHKEYNINFYPARQQIILQHRALEILQGRQYLKELLFPVKTFNEFIDTSTKCDLYNKFINDNPEQREAVLRILKQKDNSAPYIIFGPPGTGKTTTIVEAIYQLWKDNNTNNILVTGGSNACVDEIAIRLAKIFQNVDPNGRNILRIYSSTAEKKSENINENLIEMSNLCHGYQFYPNLEVVYLYRIIVTTLAIVGKYVHGDISEKHFTHVFVDECGASTETEVISGIAGIVSEKTKVVLAGDPKQLGPIIQSKKAEELGLGQSLLERLMNRTCYQVDPVTKTYDRSIQMRLIRNFRTHPRILAMSNVLYYENELIPCAKREFTDWILGWHKLPSPEFPIVFQSVKGRVEQRGRSKSLYNWAEIHVAMDYIKELMFFGVKGRKVEETDIGIISPYKSQCNFIRTELDERKWFNIEVGSVETFQGKEKPIIILSMVRSKMTELGFLTNPKRLNVSLTRAQALLIIIGNPETLAGMNDFRYVIDYCEDKNAFMGAKYSLSRAGSQSNLISECSSSVSDLKSALDNVLVNENNRDIDLKENLNVDIKDKIVNDKMDNLGSSEKIFNTTNWVDEVKGEEKKNRRRRRYGRGGKKFNRKSAELNSEQTFYTNGMDQVQSKPSSHFKSNFKKKDTKKIPSVAVRPYTTSLDSSADENDEPAIKDNVLLSSMNKQMELDKRNTYKYTNNKNNSNTGTVKPSIIGQSFFRTNVEPLMNVNARASTFKSMYDSSANTSNNPHISVYAFNSGQLTANNIKTKENVGTSTTTMTSPHISTKKTSVVEPMRNVPTLNAQTASQSQFNTSVPNINDTRYTATNSYNFAKLTGLKTNVSSTTLVNPTTYAFNSTQLTANRTTTKESVPITITKMESPRISTIKRTSVVVPMSNVPTLSVNSVSQTTMKSPHISTIKRTSVVGPMSNVPTLGAHSVSQSQHNTTVPNIIENHYPQTYSCYNPAKPASTNINGPSTTSAIPTVSISTSTPNYSSPYKNITDSAFWKDQVNKINPQPSPRNQPYPCNQPSPRKPEAKKEKNICTVS